MYFLCRSILFVINMCHVPFAYEHVTTEKNKLLTCTVGKNALIQR